MKTITVLHPSSTIETMEVKTTELENAIREVTEAVNTYGTPVWIAHVPSRVRRLVPAKIKADLIASARPSEGWRKPQDGKNDIMSWAKENVYELVTIKQLAEIGEISDATARKIVTDRPDIFVKREGRQYEVRDPQADRKAEKK